MIDWTGRTAETTELSISYVRAGSGEPVVFLHGWPEWKRSWLHNLPVLAGRFDCIAPDLRGFGATRSKVPRPEEGTPPQLLAKDLRDLVDTLGLQRVAIVSHDVGSFVAQQFALAWPERVSRLFFFNCAYPGIGQRWGDWRYFPETWYQQFHQKDFAAELVGSSREACRIYFRHFLTHWTHQKHAFAPYLEEWVDNFMAPGNLQGGFDWYIGVSRFRRRMMQEGAVAVPRIKAPTHMLWGVHDPVLRIEFADALHDYFEHVTLERAEDAGHFVHFEVPELANARLAQFLAGESG
ncbi:MAG: alpha/beta fold hydrolase [Hyphomicrobiaceae bacterium]